MATWKNIEDKRAYQNAWNRANRDKANATKKKYHQKIADFILEAKKDGCSRCGEKDPVCLAFHHRDPSMKVAEVSKLRQLSLPLVIAEIEKCDVLCFNCHAKFHWGKPLVP